MLCAGAGCGGVAEQAAKIDGVAKVLCADDAVLGAKLAEPTAAPFVPSHPRAADGFDTPSLRFVGGTAPYFHDGRFATLEDLLMNPGGRMGHTLHLSRRDALALTAYLETL